MIKRTVIGSLPRLGDDLKSSIERAVKLQLKYRINPISDGEQRYDMIRYFQQIPGINGEDNRMYISGQIRPLKDSSEAYKIREFKTTRRMLKELGEDHIEVKSSITGPITLGFTCAANKVVYYKGLLDEQLYLDLADALSPIISELTRLGAWVQIDEPGISAGYTRPSQAEKILNHLLSRVTIGEDKRSIHVCGNLTQIPGLLDNLLKVKTGVLSFAFSGKMEAGNIHVISKEKFEENGKRLGVGCVSVDARDVPEVEGESLVKERIQKIFHKIDMGNIAFLHPDCGLKNSTLKVAEKILYTMMNSTEKILRDQ